uniref:Uncharacterized protein n=1 Tax=uncultured marine thaumarchaeote KM3_88_B06 TaxID=1456332 RepID=A0A075HZF0_9ARCH|nr:hypothetical protein [uncultured marine thaumarchaeote KM3_88_B06]
MAECIEGKLTFEDLRGSLCWLQGELDTLMDQQQEVCHAIVSLNQEIGDTITTPLTAAQRKEIEDKLSNIACTFGDAQEQADDLWSWYDWIAEEVEFEDPSFTQEDERYD